MNAGQEGEAVNQGSPASRAAATPRPAHTSPSLRTGSAPPAVQPSFELKFLLAENVAGAVESWARASLQPDPHGVPALAGAYGITTLYLDTPRFDVFHRAPELEGGKLRLRSYGAGGLVYLERKKRQGNRVEKRRTAESEGEIGKIESAPAAGGPGDWFRAEVVARSFRPACLLTYLRTAFFGTADHGGFRLTLDRRIVCARASGWAVAPVGAESGAHLAAGQVVCELKFRTAMPLPLKDLVARLGLATSPVSKYRQACVATGLAGERTGRDA